jgi:DNA-directed RNA polymerase specialized sigma24 family protein
MDQKTLWQQYQALPEEVQQHMLDFLAFLQAKYASAPPSKPAPEDLAQEPFVGMWANRTDLVDTQAWLRERRKAEWREQ